MAPRALHGVNLTGWLTLEAWVAPSLFTGAGVLDEASLISAIGKSEYYRRLAQHRATFITQSDFTQIASRGFNAVRLPVPWYVFGTVGPKPGPFVECVELVDEAFDWADEIGLKIVLDLCIAPGSEGAEGELVRSHNDFASYRDEMVVVVSALAKRYASRVAFAGIEVADEPRLQVRHGFSVSEGVPIHQLRNYYRDAYAAVRQEAGPDPVVIIPDGGRPDAWKGFMAHDRYENVWLDSHLFHYNDRVKAAGPVGIRELVDSSRASLKKAAKSSLPTMVGKWSGSLPFADSITTPEGRIALERVYISEQITAFKPCAAWFFQTWKTEGRLAGWDARVSLSSFERRMLA
ncbi:MAG: cellulase family glycosylhydrolase [Olsenella sp.]|nr:cellulase family glycosylhydrolase [Olsenella sp.]